MTAGRTDRRLHGRIARQILSEKENSCYIWSILAFHRAPKRSRRPQQLKRRRLIANTPRNLGLLWGAKWADVAIAERPMNRHSIQFSKSMTSYNDGTSRCASKWRLSPTASKRLTARLKRSALRTNWKARHRAPPAWRYSAVANCAISFWARLGRLTARYRAGNWLGRSIRPWAKTRAIVGSSRTLRGASDALCERCERRGLLAVIVAEAARRVGWSARQKPAMAYSVGGLPNV